MSSESDNAISRMRALALSAGNRGRPSIIRPSNGFLEKAAQCRRLAAGIADDRTSDALIKLAEEFEAKTAADVAREKAAHAIGGGDGVFPMEKPATETKVT
jgi:hypothetical protein